MTFDLSFRFASVFFSIRVCVFVVLLQPPTAGSASPIFLQTMVSSYLRSGIHRLVFPLVWGLGRTIDASVCCLAQPKSSFLVRCFSFCFQRIFLQLFLGGNIYTPRLFLRGALVRSSHWPLVFSLRICFLASYPAYQPQLLMFSSLRLKVLHRRLLASRC